ncbi:MAG: hypothetical protein GSR79_08320 [Desulfurococcales archaeon]|nr:hypothetical protein [Desulfurococcales archaeon]
MQNEKKMLALRELTKVHYKLVLELLNTIISCNYTKIMPGKFYGQYGGPYVEAYSISPSLEKRVKKLLTEKINPYSVGLHVATIKKREIKPSLDLARYIARQCKPDNYKHTIVSSRGEQIFLYGRDVFKENIIEAPENEGLLIVLNAEKEPLGWGYLKRLNGKELLIENIKDVGWYVRSGG